MQLSGPSFGFFVRPKWTLARTLSRSSSRQIASSGSSHELVRRKAMFDQFRAVASRAFAHKLWIRSFSTFCHGPALQVFTRIALVELDRWCPGEAGTEVTSPLGCTWRLPRRGGRLSCRPSLVSCDGPRPHPRSKIQASQ